jgi:hypothetical protein
LILEKPPELSSFLVCAPVIRFVVLFSKKVRVKMLKWCSDCQQFMGEVPDFQDLNITHGLCNKCEIPRLKSAKLDLTHALVLKGIQRKLWNAGHRHDLEAAANIIANDAAKAGVRPVDVLIGIIAPLLYRIGEDWTRGTLSIEGEHRFTAFC